MCVRARVHVRVYTGVCLRDTSVHGPSWRRPLYCRVERPTAPLAAGALQQLGAVLRKHARPPARTAGDGYSPVLAVNSDTPPVWMFLQLLYNVTASAGSLATVPPCGSRLHNTDGENPVRD